MNNNINQKSYPNSNLYFNYLDETYFDEKRNDVFRVCPEKIKKRLFNNFNSQPHINKAIEDKYNQTKLYFWSDQHFFHNNIIKYSNRPFRNVGEMNKNMFENYKKHIKDDDVVIFGGDLAFGHIEEINEMLCEMPGTKILIIGNHDFENNGELKKYRKFDFMSSFINFKIKDLQNNDIDVLLSHYPIHSKHLNNKKINIHGHIHEKLAGEFNINISVEHTAYSPVLLNTKIQELFMKDENIVQNMKKP